MCEVRLSSLNKCRWTFWGRALIFVCSVLAFSCIWSQDENRDNPVEQTLRQETNEDSVLQPEGVSAEEAETGDQGNLLIALFSRVTELEAELAYLQGRVETLEHQVQELIHEERRRFADLDQRIRELKGGTRMSPDAIGSAPAGSEAAMYRDAFALVESGEYEQAIPALKALIEQFPNGEYVPDAMYWLGEIHSLESNDLEAARQQFVQMITLYADHAKAPEAMFKLGTIYHQLGDLTMALSYLERVMNDYPDHTVSRLAKDYITNLK